MNNTEKPVFRPEANCIWRSFLTSQKKHIVITGDRKSGKSTLLSSLFDRQMPGITSWAVPKEGVYMKNNSSGEVVRIGRFCSDATGCENLMQPIKDAFNSTCIAFLESLADTTAPWITVDEFGYLENTSYDYQKAFERLMNKKRIIMVVRKQDLSFLNWLCSHKDVFLVDLDRPFGNSGCIIMASGQGKRFGSNKLMAEYHGQPLIKWILDITKDLFARRLVVTIHQDIEKLCTEYSIPVILHSSPYRNDMIRLGLDTIGSYIDRCAFIPSDQPLIKTESIASLLLCAKNEPSYIWRTCYDKTPGSPVIFPKEYFDELMSLPQGKGGNVVVHSHESQVRQLPVTNKTELMDIDTPADMARL